MGGYQDRVLRVNLTTGKFTEEPLDEKVCRDYIGGRGFGIKWLYDELKPGVDPLGPENKLIFLAGPLGGTSAQSFGRWKVFFKSPLTGGYFKSSGGGRFAAELKFAGLDGIIIEGKAEKPVYLWINEGKYQLRDATYLSQLNCDDTHTLIREELRDCNIRVACIGSAGDNLVKYAGIFSDRRCAGRGGGGAVMGAKNLKAIAVRGKGKVPLSDPDAFTAAVREEISIIRNDPHYAEFARRGTQNPEFCLTLGMFPTRNFREGVLPDWHKIEGVQYNPMRVRDYACYNCMVHCGNLTKVHSGPYCGWWSEGPEYETIWGFTGPFVTNEIGLTVAGDRLCDELGLDTVSATGSIGLAYELYERGIITKEDTGGLELVYGNHEPVLPLLRQIAARQGIGDLLAEGTREMARRIGQGSEVYAIHVKGLELPGYDPRGAKAHGLNLMTTAIGADHNSGYGTQEIQGVPYKGKKLNRFATEGKGELAKYNQDLTAIHETGILCVFPSVLFFRDNLDLYGRLLVAATGIKDFSDPDYLWLVGDRINNLERLFNVREGFGRKDDAMPRRITGQTLPEGPSAGQRFEAEELLDDYYQARGWDLKTGVPTKKKLKELGLA
ncbi:MAG: aldehyde ferredoxin oxidoreductase family protein [Chloroflexota bacterium]